MKRNQWEEKRQALNKALCSLAWMSLESRAEFGGIKSGSIEEVPKSNPCSHSSEKRNCSRYDKGQPEIAGMVGFHHQVFCGPKLLKTRFSDRRPLARRTSNVCRMT